MTELIVVVGVVAETSVDERVTVAEIETSIQISGHQKPRKNISTKKTFGLDA